MKAKISELEGLVSEGQLKNAEINAQLDTMGQNLRMEQETSNNLLVSLEAS